MTQNTQHKRNGLYSVEEDEYIRKTCLEAMRRGRTRKWTTTWLVKKLGRSWHGIDKRIENLGIRWTQAPNLSLVMTPIPTRRKSVPAAPKQVTSMKWTTIRWTLGARIDLHCAMCVCHQSGMSYEASRDKVQVMLHCSPDSITTALCDFYTVEQKHQQGNTRNNLKDGRKSEEMRALGDVGPLFTQVVKQVVVGKKKR